MSRLRKTRDQGGRPAISLQDLGQRLSFVILACAAVILLFAGRSGNEQMEQVRTALSDVTAPLLEFSSRPVQMLRAGFEGVDQYFNSVEENQILRKELARLQAWQSLALKLQNENKEFRSLLNAQDLPEPPFISARVIGDLGSPFVHTVLINVGQKQGVKKDMPVVGADGLIGRIVSSGNNVSRVLLLSDLNSRVPVRLEGSGYQSVLAGDNETNPQLFYLPVGANISVGDRIVTSGHGGVFPPGIPIGTISSVNKGASTSEIRIRTFMDEHRLGFVRVIQYKGVEAPPGTMSDGATDAADPEAKMNIVSLSNSPSTNKRGQ